MPDKELNVISEKTDNKYPTIEWSVLEHAHQDRSSNWFWLVGIIGILGIVGAILLKNFLFAIIILISTFIIILYGSRRPEEIRINLSKKGLLIKNDLYPYNNIMYFSIKDYEESHKLMLYIDRAISPKVIIPIGDIDPDIIRDFLTKFVEEQPYEESISDLISERLGF